MKALSDFTVTVQGIIAGLFSNVMLIAGIGPTGAPVPLNVDSQGNLATSPTVSLGVAGVRFTSADQSGSAAAVTDVPAAGLKLVLTDIRFSVDTAMRVDFIDDGNSNVLFSEYVPANGGGQITLSGKLKLSTAAKALKVQTSAAGNIAVSALFYSEP